MSNKEINKTESFLVDEKDIDETKSYVRPNYIETELSPDRKKEARDIVKTINEFGVSQRQKLFIIYLLTLELEDRDTMHSLVDAIGKYHKNIKTGKICIPSEEKKKLIL